MIHVNDNNRSWWVTPQSKFSGVKTCEALNQNFKAKDDASKRNHQTVTQGNRIVHTPSDHSLQLSDKYIEVDNNTKRAITKQCKTTYLNINCVWTT